MRTDAGAAVVSRLHNHGAIEVMRKAAILNWIIYRAVQLGRRSRRVPRWRIGIYKVDRLGDFVLSIGAIGAIVEAAGEENCVLFHSPVSSRIARREFPGIVRIEVPPLDGKLWVTRRRLHRLVAHGHASGGVGQLLCLRHFRTLFDEVALQMIPASSVWCVRNSKAFSLDYELVRRRFEGDVEVDRPVPDPGSGTCEDLRCHERLLRAWAGDSFAGRDIRPRVEAASSPRNRVLAIAPFGSDKLRDLPARSVAACVIHAQAALGLDSVLLSPPDAIPRYEAFARQLAGQGATAGVQVTQTSDDLVDAIAASAAVLTTETATAHIATALDRPMVCVIGGGHYGLFAPWSRSIRQAWLTLRVPCFHCNWQCPHPEPYCITGVRAEQLVQALERVLGAPSPVPIQANA